ncbi:hypothetical protein ANANG_G00094820 [Anguilla anguilla]|uniref:Uncharacterized protein n=1 Tax=Anguilla anguilla TaxID=7936 RepID=A0A9D3RYP2_ANGAN|nr:hypothetical protein ANANG_G00094820 [Anguilla anguilla]
MATRVLQRASRDAVGPGLVRPRPVRVTQHLANSPPPQVAIKPQTGPQKINMYLEFLNQHVHIENGITVRT